MSFKDLSLKKAYNSEDDNIIFDFYLPVLQNCVEYNRLVGYFSSTSLAVSAKGIMGLIKNEGIIKIIASAQLNKQDIELIKKQNVKVDKIIEKKFLDDIDKIKDDFIRDHLFALGWLLYNKKLELKIAIVLDKEGYPISGEELYRLGIFHQKVGILKDTENNIISFSGSINETANAWLGNIEEFKVFKSWINSEKEWVLNDIKKFEKYWANNSNLMRVIDVPKAIKEKLIEIAPKYTKKINLEKWYKEKEEQPKPELFKHQKEAIQEWIENNYLGIFEMATGTGKTFTALGCLDNLQNINKHIAIIISCPYNHLIHQWKSEISKFNLKYEKLIIADSSNYKWKREVFNYLANLDMYSTKSVLIITTHDTLSGEKFRDIIESFPEIQYLLIADEVHGLGSPKRKKGLNDIYKYRLGLSATPKRWFDDFGTKKIYEYFNKTVFEFTLQDALININPKTGRSYLCPYYYKISFVTLNEEELKNYITLTYKIVKLLNKDDDESLEKMESLFFKRADIIKNADKKFNEIETILDSIETLDATYNGTIIYVSPQQKQRVLNILYKRNLRVHKFTMEEDTKPSDKYNGISEREFILKKFIEGKIQILVAMKCLDEGVDVPSAKNAILLSNSGNPREYIQRIGRVIRQHKNKKRAYIYDIVVKPDFENIPIDLRKYEMNIFRKELIRLTEIGRNASNYVETLTIIDKELEIL